MKLEEMGYCEFKESDLPKKASMYINNSCTKCGFCKGFGTYEYKNEKIECKEYHNIEDTFYEKLSKKIVYFIDRVVTILKTDLGSIIKVRSQRKP